MILLLFLGPSLLWYATSPRWHPLLAILYASFGLLVAGYWLRGIRRDIAERNANPSKCRWRAQTTPETFCHQLATSLRLQGWQIVLSTIGERARVEVIAKKDRCQVALLCVGPAQYRGDAGDLDRLAVIRQEARTSHAALVGAAVRDGLIREAASRMNVLLLRFDDLNEFDRVFGAYS